MHGSGVGTTRDMGSVITGIFWPSWWFRGYTIGEKINLWRGRAFSRSFGLGDQALHTDLRDVVPKLEIPVYIFQGRYDYTAATPLAHDYFEQFQAPVKEFLRGRQLRAQNDSIGMGGRRCRHRLPSRGGLGR